MSVDEPLILQTTINNKRFLSKKPIFPILIFGLLACIVFGTLLNGINKNSNLSTNVSENSKLETNQTNDPIVDILLSSNDSNGFPSSETVGEVIENDDSRFISID